ncbi:MAG: hypothetical protein E7505_06230 [Ruminococcus sp.]|nr:hypothetical protein [Ruminococcus sp.]
MMFQKAVRFTLAFILSTALSVFAVNTEYVMCEEHSDMIASEAGSLPAVSGAPDVSEEPDKTPVPEITDVPDNNVPETGATVSDSDIGTEVIMTPGSEIVSTASETSYSSSSRYDYVVPDNNYYYDDNYYYEDYQEDVAIPETTAPVTSVETRSTVSSGTTRITTTGRITTISTSTAFSETTTEPVPYTGDNDKKNKSGFNVWILIAALAVVITGIVFLVLHILKTRKIQNKFQNALDMVVSQNFSYGNDDDDFSDPKRKW